MHQSILNAAGTLLRNLKMQTEDSLDMHHQEACVVTARIIEYIAENLDDPEIIPGTFIKENLENIRNPSPKSQ